MIPTTVTDPVISIFCCSLDFLQVLGRAGFVVIKLNGTGNLPVGKEPLRSSVPATPQSATL